MRRKVDREQIIEAGLALMLEKGFEGTGVKEIADRTGMLKGSFYNHFKSKEEFAKVLIEKYSTDSIEIAKAVLLNPKTSPVKRIEQLFDLLWKKVNAGKECTDGCFLGNFSQEVGNINPVLSAVVDQEFLKIKALYIACIKEGQEQGEISASQDPGTLAEFLINSWEGMLLRAKSSRNDVPFKSFKELIFNTVLK